MKGKLEDNGSVPLVRLEDGEGCTISLRGNFGGGTVVVEEDVNGTFYPIESAEAIISDFGKHFQLSFGDIIRVTLSGATAPDLDWKIAGAISTI